MTQLTLAEEGLETIFGTHDENIRRIEREFGVTVTARGGEVAVAGAADDVAPAAHSDQCAGGNPQVAGTTISPTASTTQGRSRHTTFAWGALDLTRARDESLVAPQ